MLLRLSLERRVIGLGERACATNEGAGTGEERGDEAHAYGCKWRWRMLACKWIQGRMIRLLKRREGPRGE